MVKLIEKQKRKPIYADFEDDLGAETIVELPGFVAADQLERFKAKARVFLKEHRDHATIRKLRLNRPLTTADLETLGCCGDRQARGRTQGREKSRGASAGAGSTDHPRHTISKSAARKSHRKRTVRKLHNMGIRISRLPRCGWGQT